MSWSESHTTSDPLTKMIFLKVWVVDKEHGALSTLLRVQEKKERKTFFQHNQRLLNASMQLWCWPLLKVIICSTFELLYLETANVFSIFNLKMSHCLTFKQTLACRIICSPHPALTHTSAKRGFHSDAGEETFLVPQRTCKWMVLKKIFLVLRTFYNTWSEEQLCTLKNVFTMKSLHACLHGPINANKEAFIVKSVTIS